jgi:hypothetical protein
VIVRLTVALVALGCAHAAIADGAPGAAAVAWSPMSTTSVSVTGPITLSATRLTSQGATFPLRLTATNAAFRSDDGARPARVFAVTRPTNPPLLNGNTLCGPDPATWLVAVDRAVGQLELIAATGAAPPTREEAPAVCGIFYYDRH